MAAGPFFAQTTSAGSALLGILVVFAVVVLPIAAVFLWKLRKRNSIVRSSQQVTGVVLESTIVNDGRSASTGSIATNFGEPGHFERGRTTQGAPDMKIRVRAELPGGRSLEYEEKVSVQRLDSVAVGAEVTVYYDADRPDRATIAPDGYYEVNPDGYLFEPSPMVIDLRSLQTGVESAPGANAALLERLAGLRDAGVLGSDEFEAEKRKLLGG